MSSPNQIEGTTHSSQESLYAPQHEVESPVDSKLMQRLGEHLDIHFEVLEKHGIQYSREQALFLEGSGYGVLLERNRKAIESRTPEVREAIDIAKGMLQYETDGTFCIDGRIKRLRVYGFVPGMAAFMHTPAGENNEFVQGEGEELELIEDSYYGSLLDKKYQKHDVVNQIRDAHQHCAAKGIMEGRPGTLQDDHGLYQSVVRQMKEIAATKRYVEDKYDGAKRFIGTVTSFNPENGYLMLGLDRKEALEKGEENGFTSRVLRDLVDGGVVIDTRQFTTNSEEEYRVIREAFDARYIENFDWIGNFSQSLVSFWRNMKDMQEAGVIDHVGNMLRERYNGEGSPEEEHLDERTIQHYAVLLVANAYSAYSTQKAGIRDYSVHDENIVIMSEAENGPYDKFSSFIVNSRLTEELPTSVVLAIDIINSNIDRESKPIIDPVRLFDTQAEYRKAPKIGVAKELVREDLPWDKIRDVSLTDMPKNWATMTPEEFRDYLKGKFDFLLIKDFDALLGGAERLRGIAVALNRNKTTRHLIQEKGHFVPFYALCDRDRMIHTLLPFIERGYARPQRERVVFATVGEESPTA